MPKPARRATSSTERSVVSSSSRACSTRCRVSHCGRAEPGLVAEPPGEGPHAHPGVRGQRRQVERLVEMGQRPGAGRAAAVDGRSVRHVAHDELRLAAVPPRRHHAAPGGAVGDLAAEVAADQVQAQVDARPRPRPTSARRRRRRRARRGPAAPAGNAAEQVGVGPVRRRGPAVEPADRGERERGGADRDQPGAGRHAAQRGDSASVEPGRRRPCDPCTPGMITVSASARISGPWSGSTGTRPRYARAAVGGARAHLVERSARAGRVPPDGAAKDLRGDAEVEARPRRPGRGRRPGGAMA